MTGSKTEKTDRKNNRNREGGREINREQRTKEQT